MAKEKTRAELHVIIEGLKNDLENATIAHRELKEKYDALEADRDSQHKLAMEWQRKWSVLYDDREACEKSLNHANKVIKEDDAKIADLEKDVDKQRAIIEHIEADLDKAQYIADDLLGHGIFHFLIVKYRNSHSNGKKS